MRLSSRASLPAISPCLISLLVSCGGSEGPDPEPATVPVTVITLQRESPALAGRLAGLAEPYRAEAVGFEVAGRVDFVSDVGMELAGPTLAGDGRVLEEGELIARLDSQRYAQALESARLAVESGRRRLEAQQLEVDTVARSQLAQATAEQQVALEDVNRAQADADFARTELTRQSQLLAEGVVAQAEVDRAQRDLDSATAALEAARSGLIAAEAAVAQAEDNIRLQEAAAEQIRAEIAEQEQRVVQAETDLDDCRLSAPFTGRITERHVGRGAYATQGSPVVTLTMMDPIKVVLMLSAEKSRRVLPGTQAQIFPRNLESFTGEEALYGVVFEKAEVADTETRTFRVEVIARNVRRSPYVSRGDGGQAAAIDRVMPVLTREAGAEGALFVHPRCFLEEDGRSFVLRIPGVKLGLESTADLRGIIQPEKLPVTPEAEFFTMRMSFQKVSSSASLKAGDVLIMDPRPEQLGGAAMAGYDWAIRPGDLVPVVLEVGSAPEGFYVPVEAIATLNGEASVFVVGEDGRARQVTVSLHESQGLARRIEGPDLTDGARIVLEGIHYVQDGDLVRVVTALGS